MGFGLGLSLDLTSVVPAGASSQDAATVISALSPTGWWNGDNYSSVTGIATGITSAGGSGGRNLPTPNGLTKPSKGNTINGYNGIIFNGSTNNLVSVSLQMDTLISLSAHTIFSVFIVTDSDAAPGDVEYEQPCVLTEAFGDFVHAPVSSTGTSGAYIWDNADKAAVGAMSFGSIHIVESWHDGVTLSSSIDGGTPATIAAGPITSVHNVAMAANYGGGPSVHWFHGTVYEVTTFNTTLSSGDRTSIRRALGAKYGIVVL